MVQPIPQDLLDELGKPDGKFPFLLFLELAVSTNSTARTMFRLVRYPKQITFLGKTWYPFAFQISALTAGEGGDLPSVTITVEDPTQEVRPWLHVAGAFRGKTVKLYWVHWSTLASGSHVPYEFQVVSAEADGDSIDIELRWPNFFDEAFPHDHFNRGRCRWLQGSVECGDFRKQVDCGRTRAGCELVGEDWAAAGLHPLHPRRYSGYDSIPNPPQ